MKDSVSQGDSTLCDATTFEGKPMERCPDFPRCPCGGPENWSPETPRCTCSWDAAACLVHS